MGDFFTAPAGSPLPPPEPDTPAPDFETFASNLGIGLAKSGVFGSFLVDLWNWAVRLLTYIVGFLVWVLLKVFAYFIKLIGQATTDAQSAYGDVVAATLKELFGIEVSPADVNTRQGGPNRQAVANKLAQSVIGTMFTGAQAVAGGGVVPSSNAADNFLATIMNMELNGWIESFVTDGVSGHILEKYGDLKDGIARVLGIGRMARQVFRAPIKILVSDPYTALLQQKFRTRPWETQALLDRLYRGELQRADLSVPLGNQGWTEAQIDELVISHQKRLSLADLDYLDRRNLLIGDYWKQKLMEQGYASGTADLVIQVARDQRLHKYQMEMVSVGETAYVAGNIGLDTFTTIVQQAGLTDDEQQWIINLATLKVSVKTRHFTEAEIIKGIEDGILNFNDLKTWAIREGMSPTDEALLELEVQFQENKASALAKAKAATAQAKVAAANAKLQAAQQKAAVAKAQASDAGLSASRAGVLVKEGIWNIAQYTSFLQTHGYGPDAVIASTQLLQAELDAAKTKAAAAGTTRATAAAKGLNLAQLEKAVIEGIVSQDRLSAYLTDEGYSAQDVQVIIDLTQHELTAAQVKADAKKAAVAKAATKSISIPDLDRAVRLGLTSVDAYQAALQRAGFDAASVALLVSILQAQVTADKATAAQSAAAASEKSAKGITLAQLEQEVINGVRPIGDYTAALASIGYGHDDQTQLTQLLQLKVDQAKATAAKRAAAASALEAKGLSLPDTERAVKLGIVPIATYQAMLRSLHYTQDAIDVLSNTLLAEMAATKRAQASTGAAAAALATKGISLPDLEKAVVAGVRPIADYTAALTAAGYTADAAGTLTQLLQLKADQAVAAAAAHADAEGVATARGISLGKEEAAVVAGARSMADYDALLIALGYDDVDRATLEQLLQTKVDAATAKAGGGAGSGSGGGTTPNAGGA